jgi:pimeloyl-ACP methyl ester carboxylesterase
MKPILLTIFIVLLVLYLLICGLLYLFQEHVIFFPEKLDKKFTFHFDQNFEELNIKMQDGILLNGLLFKSDSSKGLIFYLHGNAGSLNSWGDVAKTYTKQNYDVFILDYRGYGKSEGSINSQEQLFQDVQSTYNEMKKRYSEDKIIVLGYSIGSGPATKIASSNHPKLLILQAPYYSLKDLMKHTYRIVPTFLLKYTLETNEYIKNCNMPIVLFHGDKDEVIYYESSVKLKELLKPTDKLIILQGEGHGGITDNSDYRNEIRKILQ